MQKWLADLPDSTSPDILQGAVRDKVAQILRQNALRDVHGRQYFIPPSHICTLFPYAVVLQLLEVFLGPSDSAGTNAASVRDIARHIAPDPSARTCPACKHPYCTGRRLLFLSLIAIAQEIRVERFHHCLQELDHEREHNFQGTCDNLLAPRLHTQLGATEVSADHEGQNPPTSLYGLAATWTHAERETVRQLFHRVQGHRFERGHGEMRRWNPQWKRMDIFLWSELDEGITLPWVEHTQGRGTLPDGPSRNVSLETRTSSGLNERRSLPSNQGQFASVWRVKIHREYHDLVPGDPDTDFALKTLKEGDPQRTRRAFQKEIEANIRVGSHERVVTFLTVFEHRNRQYLLMPWANGGSLRHLWKRLTSAEEENPIFPDWCTSKWLLNQCVGLASGLVHIHDPQTKTDSPASPTGTDNPASPTSPVGDRPPPLRPAPQLHVDIKPENILAFSDHGDISNNPVTLKFGDLGLSMKLDPKKGGVSMKQIKILLSYRPPDEELGREYARPQWDTWCLGCSILELITWFATGYHGVRKFRKMRNGEKGDARVAWNARDEEDSFFRLKAGNPWTGWIPGVGYTRWAEVKRCVMAQMVMLKGHSRVKDDERLPKLLDFILERMLVIDDGRRATAQEVLQGLETLKGVDVHDQPLYSREDSGARGSHTSQASSLESMDPMGRSSYSSQWSDGSIMSLRRAQVADMAVEPVSVLA